MIFIGVSIASSISTYLIMYVVYLIPLPGGEMGKERLKKMPGLKLQKSDRNSDLNN